MKQNSKDLISIIDKLNTKVENLSSITIDYAHWDDTYEFIQNKNFTFINNNFPDDSTIENLDIDFMVFIDKKNDVVFSTFLDEIKKDTKLTILKTLLSNKVKNSKEIILPINENIYFISKTQIKKSDATGTKQGLIVSGTKIKSSYLNKLFNKKITINNKLPYEGIKDIDLSNQYFKKIYVDISYSSEQIINHIHFLSNTDKDLMTLSYLENRDIYLEGKRQIIIFNIVISILSLIMFFIFIKYISFQNKINKELERRIEEELNKRREQEQILIQQSKLASMGEMIGNIAHQWRQPLNALSMVIQNLDFAYHSGDLDNELMKRSQTKSKILIDKMSTTIDDFRNFFKPSKLKSHFNLNTTVLNSLEMMSSNFESHNINVIEELNNEIPEVFALENELSQVILILLSNAKDALVDDEITNANITIKTYNIDNNVFISVKDNANGIKKELLDKIFEPYFTTKKDTNGTGIGLYMAKTIIEQNMNGKLSVNTSADGSEFIIELKN